ELLAHRGDLERGLRRASGAGPDVGRAPGQLQLDRPRPGDGRRTGQALVHAHPASLAGGPLPYRLRWTRSAWSSSAMSAAGSRPTRLLTRSTAMERTCSACALESRRSPVSRAGSRTWNG